MKFVEFLRTPPVTDSDMRIVSSAIFYVISAEFFKKLSPKIFQHFLKEDDKFFLISVVYFWKLSRYFTENISIGPQIFLSDLLRDTVDIFSANHNKYLKR